MSKGIDWASAPEGYPIWVESKVSTDISDWHRLESNGFLRDRKGGRWEPWQVRDGECVPHYKPEWNGEGFPPAGTDCEYRLKGWEDWIGCTVLCVGGFKTFIRSSDAGEATEWNIKLEFRPIRTAEQIAADERLHKIRNALRTIKAGRHFSGDEARSNVMVATVEAMIDAGYVQQVAP